MERLFDDVGVDPSVLLPRNYHQLSQSTFDNENSKNSSNLHILRPFLPGIHTSKDNNILDVKVRPDLWSPDKRMTIHIPINRKIPYANKTRDAQGMNSPGAADEEDKFLQNQVPEIVVLPKPLQEEAEKDVTICPKRPVSKSVRRLLQQRIQRWAGPSTAKDCTENKFESLLSTISPNQIVNFIGLNKGHLLPPVYGSFGNLSGSTGGINSENKQSPIHLSNKPPSYSARNELLQRGYVTGFPPPYHLK